MGADRPQFLFVVCQRGAEAPLKREFAREWPEFRLAYSRPGFVTFKLPDNFDQTDDFELKSVFARASGFSLGRVSGVEAPQLASQTWELFRDRPYPHLHVWQRDTSVPGDFHFEPGVSPLAESIGDALIQACPLPDHAIRLNEPAHAGQYILDCFLAEPNEWWLGYHLASSVPSRWPGGVIESEIPEHMISRAYLKTAESLDWSRLPIQPGDHCVELGASPGGSCQALLDRGLNVWGIDPADIDDELLRHPRFVHIRKRAADLQRREFSSFKWLFADLNVAPQFTLDAVEGIVTHRSVQVRGMLLTLKFSNWDLAEQIPAYIDRIRSWGYEYVRVRQLAFNRQEICVAVMKSRSMRRIGAERSKKKRKSEVRPQSNKLEA